MALLRALFFAILAVSLVSTQDYYITVFTQDGNGAVLNIDTGNVSCESAIPMPTPSPGCEWSMLTGTRGQTIANFPMNNTYFFTAQERCQNGTVGNAFLIQAHGPYPNPCWGKVSTMLKARLQTNDPIESLNMAWDHTCNIVVLYSSQDNGEDIIQTRQVSEYDGQDRPQPNYSDGPGSCWKKVDGLGALDFGNVKSSWLPGAEWNCGNTCVFYTVEQCTIDGKVTYPRALIGKYYRTGELAYNITDSVQIQTMTYFTFTSNLPKLQLFVGIGICCTEPWCHKQCQGLDNHLVLVQYLSNTQEFTVLEDLGDFDPMTVKLGVEFSSLFGSKQALAFVYHDNTVISYILAIGDNGITGVTRRSQQVVLKPLSAWIGH